MNWSRILFAGLLAGLVIDSGEYLLHLIVLPDKWKAAMQKLNLTPVPASREFLALTAAGLLLGAVTLWLYAAIVPRYGARARTAILAALGLWIPGYFLGLAAMLLEGILPLDIVILSMTAGLAELVCGALLGRLIYADASSASKGEEVAT
jgi:hypothetical protein